MYNFWEKNNRQFVTILSQNKTTGFDIFFIFRIFRYVILLYMKTSACMAEVFLLEGFTDTVKKQGDEISCKTKKLDLSQKPL